jgi:hypothetical protein
MKTAMMVLEEGEEEEKKKYENDHMTYWNFTIWVT